MIRVHKNDERAFVRLTGKTDGLPLWIAIDEIVDVQAATETISNVTKPYSIVGVRDGGEYAVKEKHYNIVQWITR